MMMEKIKNNKGALINVICAVLMVVLLVLQFTPFWHYGEAGEACSISDYVWFPTDHKDVESWIAGQVEGHTLNGFVAMPILVLVLSAVGAVLCMVKLDNGWMALLPTACGAVGSVAYLMDAALKLGAGWMWHLVICIALLALGILNLVQCIKERQA